MSTASGPDTFIAYHYQPSLALALAFTAIFTVSTLLHSYQLLRTRSTYLLPLALGTLAEAIGYVGRTISSRETYPTFSLGPYILQAILILIAPALLAASIYMVLGYIIQSVDGERHSLIREKWLTKIFVVGDVVSFLVQSTGAGLLTKKPESDGSGANAPKAGQYIIIGGLALQLLFFGMFVVVATTFFVRMVRKPTPAARASTGGGGDGVPWRKHLCVILAASVLIMVRSVFRVVEYVQGKDGYLLSTEVYLYIFDAALMAALVVGLNIVHPSQLVGGIKGTGGVVWLVVLKGKKRKSDGLDGSDGEAQDGEDRAV